MEVDVEVVREPVAVMAAGLPHSHINRAVPVWPAAAELLPTLLQGLKPMDA
jgi:hypothetical protein